MNKISRILFFVEELLVYAIFGHPSEAAIVYLGVMRVCCHMLILFRKEGSQELPFQVCDVSPTFARAFGTCFQLEV